MKGIGGRRKKDLSLLRGKLIEPFLEALRSPATRDN